MTSSKFSSCAQPSTTKIRMHQSILLFLTDHHVLTYFLTPERMRNHLRFNVLCNLRCDSSKYCCTDASFQYLWPSPGKLNNCSYSSDLSCCRLFLSLRLTDWLVLTPCLVNSRHYRAKKSVLRLVVCKMLRLAWKLINVSALCHFHRWTHATSATSCSYFFVYANVFNLQKKKQKERFKSHL